MKIFSSEVTVVVLLCHIPLMAANECGSKFGNQLYIITKYLVSCV